MVKIKCLSVYCGDAILINFPGDDKKNHNILIDGGFVKTYRTILRPEIDYVLSRNEKIDLLIVTHYDADHIGGIIALINDKTINSDSLIDRWCLNIDLPLITNSTISIKQLLTLKNELNGKDKYPKTPIVVGAPDFELFGAILTVLSPDEVRYNIATNQVEGKFTEVANVGNDYRSPIEHFEQIVSAEPREDNQASNGSSIAVLLTIQEKRVLFLADAYPSVVSASIRNLGYNESENPLKIDCLKLSHHASRANISNELLGLIKTNKFIISANAQNTHNLPNKETIVRILLKAKRCPNTYFDFYFTHKNVVLESMFAVDGLDVYEKWRFRMHFPDAGESGIYIP